METIHTTQDGLPTVAATAPMENSTSGGTPLATQNAPVQSMPRSTAADLGSAPVLAGGKSFAVLLKLPPVGRRSRHSTLPHGNDELHSRIRSAGRIVAPIDRKVGTRDVARAVGAQEWPAPGPLARGGEPPHGNSRRQLLQVPLQIAALLGKNVVHHLRVNLAGTNRIHANIVAGVIQGHAARDLHHRCFAGAVGDVVGFTIETPLGGNIHDRALALVLHVPNRGTAQVE